MPLYLLKSDVFLPLLLYHRGMNDPIEEPLVEIEESIAETDSTQPPADAPVARGETYEAIQSITRLLVGGALAGSDELIKRLHQLEREIAAAEEADRMRQGETAVDPSITDNEHKRVRYALIGLVFEGQNAVRKRIPLMKRIARLGVNSASLAVDVMSDNRVGREINGRFNQFATQGNHTVNRWIERGRQEESTSRQLSLLMLSDVIDDFIGNLAENEEISDLVTQQSVGLAGEVVDTVREQTVTADTIVERIARAVLRRPPRETDGIKPQTTTIDENGNIIPPSPEE